MNDLMSHIRQLNAKTEAWVAENPQNRFATGLVEDEAHWAEYGVKTPAQLEHYLLVVDVFEQTRNVWGYKPHWGALMASTTDQLKAEMVQLNRVCVAQRKQEVESRRLEKKLRRASHRSWVAKKATYFTNQTGWTVGQIVGSI
jgi:hypothetical protein